MQQGYWYTANRHFAKLEDAEAVGAMAAKRALRRLGSRKIKTTRVPIVFDPDMAAGLIHSIAGAASGPSLYKGASFLVGKLGERSAASGVTSSTTARMPGGLGSKPFDGEGLPTNRKSVVERGVLKTYLLDCYSARKLGLRRPATRRARSATRRRSAPPISISSPDATRPSRSSARSKRASISPS